jgi:hypothetical protein
MAQEPEGSLVHSQQPAIGTYIYIYHIFISIQ